MNNDLPDWPAAMNQKMAAAYCGLSVETFSYSIPRVDGGFCSDAEEMCAGYSPEETAGRNCNDRHNSWGTGNGKGGGISNNKGSG